jgi:hypothetical protein
MSLSMSRNSPIAPGRVVCRWARSWLPSAIRVVTRSWRARTVIRSVTVAAESGVSGRSRARSVRTVRTVSARTNASNESSLFPAEP